ncbi:unnamed protein product [Protopolystoma xenopodis]|uniref:Uncharacterized protein n=1 Tax=Protopolystoma xenopodis TaxID=117903 RepID=A0A3S5AEQ4_9PLAT|nr:unnamed protein product [Protopolystoma xenopodis]
MRRASLSIESDATSSVAVIKEFAKREQLRFPKGVTCNHRRFSLQNPISSSSVQSCSGYQKLLPLGFPKPLHTSHIYAPFVQARPNCNRFFNLFCVSMAHEPRRQHSFFPFLHPILRSVCTNLQTGAHQHTSTQAHNPAYYIFA